MLIKDLSKELDTKAMTAVRGGDNGNSATNVIGQAMNLSVPVAVLSTARRTPAFTSTARRRRPSGTTSTPAIPTSPCSPF